MFNTLVKIMVGVTVKLLTANFFEKLILMGLKSLSAKTTNTLDDEIVATVAEALGKQDWYATLK